MLVGSRFGVWRHDLKLPDEPSEDPLDAVPSAASISHPAGRKSGVFNPMLFSQARWQFALYQGTVSAKPARAG
jgi:hypothetical protein